MGRLLKHRVKDDKWRLWTTISDGWLTDWLTEDEMKQAIAEEYKHEYRCKVIELYMTFPAGYYNKEVSLRNGRPVNPWFRNDEGREAFYAWQQQAFKGDYYAEVDKKFKELTGNTA